MLAGLKSDIAATQKKGVRNDKGHESVYKTLGFNALKDIVAIMDHPKAFKENITDSMGAVIATWLDSQRGINDMLRLVIQMQTAMLTFVCFILSGLVLSLSSCHHHSVCIKDAVHVQATLSELKTYDNVDLFAGSVCKDWSPMSSQSGFCGKWMPLFGVMIGLIRAIKPRCFFHENSNKFDSSVFEQLLADLKYELHHEILDPRDFGLPVRRPRAWDCILRPDVALATPLKDIAAFKTPVVLDAGAFLLASEEEAGSRSRN